VQGSSVVNYLRDSFAGWDSFAGLNGKEKQGQVSTLVGLNDSGF